MQNSFGTHEIHRTFKPSPSSRLGYLTIVFSQTTCDPSHPKADPSEPDVVARLSFNRQAMGVCEPVDIVVMVMDLIYALTGTKGFAITAWGHSQATIVLGLFLDSFAGQGMSTIANAMSPKDPNLERRIEEAFYLTQ